MNDTRSSVLDCQMIFGVIFSGVILETLSLIKRSRLIESILFGQRLQKLNRNYNQSRLLKTCSEYVARMVKKYVEMIALFLCATMTVTMVTNWPISFSSCKLRARRGIMNLDGSTSKGQRCCYLIPI